MKVLVSLVFAMTPWTQLRHANYNSTLYRPWHLWDARACLIFVRNWPPSVPLYILFCVYVRRIEHCVFFVSSLQPHCINMARGESSRRSDKIQNQSVPNGTLSTDVEQYWTFHIERLLNMCVALFRLSFFEWKLYMRFRKWSERIEFSCTSVFLDYNAV